MALIKSFEHKSMDRNSIHDAIESAYSTFERDGTPRKPWPSLSIA